jgi:predicted MFS family arabinose efflux permease
MLAAFIALERHQRLPMLDLTLFRDATFAGANTVMLLSSLAMFGVFFYVTLYMQQVMGLSPVKAGVLFLPMTALIITLAPQAGHLADRIGSRLLVGTGQSLVALSLFLYSRLTAESSIAYLLLPMVVSGAGMALTMTPATAAALSAVSHDKAGVGSAVLNSARQVGGSIGIALMGAVVAARLSTALRAGATQRAAFMQGIQGGFLVAALIAVVSAAIGFSTLRKHEHTAMGELVGG